jgi:nitrogenase molybdenum-iron protein NifN
MLDAHFHFSGKRVAIAADPDLLCAMVDLFVSMGAEVPVAIASTKNSPLLESLACAEVRVGDLSDLETLAESRRADWLVTHSHGRQAAERLKVPLFRLGFPIFDRLGHQHRALGGYVGTRDLIFELANQQLARAHEPSPEGFQHSHRPLVVEMSHATS